MAIILRVGNQSVLGWTTDLGRSVAQRLSGQHDDHDAVEALEIDRSESDVDWLEAPYDPLAVAGHD